MPRPVVLTVCVFGAGLGAGLSRFPDPRLMGIAGLALWLVLRRTEWDVLPAAALLGLVLGVCQAQAGRYQCGARIPAGRVRLTARLHEPADSGLVHAAPTGRCAGQIMLRWPPGASLPAGQMIRLTGRWIPGAARDRPEGLLLVEGQEPLGASPGPAEELRNWVTRAADSLYGARAPMVDALVLGRRGVLPPAIHDGFTQSGLVHILSISGFHVGLLSAWCMMLMRAFGFRLGPSLAGSALVALLYVGFLGWPAPALRAATVGGIVAWNRWRQRRVAPSSMLALSGLAVVLLDPAAIASVGAWLSVGALWGAGLFARWSEAALGRSRFLQAIWSSIGATLATAPLTAWGFGTVAPIGIALNFVAVPLAAVAVPGVVLSFLLWRGFPAFAHAVATGAGLTLYGLERIVVVGGSVPGGHVTVPPTAWSAFPWAVALILAVWSLGFRNTRWETFRRVLWAGGLAAWVSLIIGSTRLAADADSGLTLHFLDVGQGDGAVIHTPGNHWVLIDAGPRGDRTGDAGERVIVPFLAGHRVHRLAAFVLSHAHADHLGGAKAVLEQFPADLVVEPGDPVDVPMYLDFLDQLATESIRWHAGRPGEHFEIDGVRFSVLHPDTTWAEWGRDLNEDSVVLKVEYGAFQALFPGDAGLLAEEDIQSRYGPVDLLKVGHHGSHGATGSAFLSETHPAAAVVSVGAHNTYGHPSPETLHRLEQAGVDVWRTDLDGSVTVVVGTTTMTVRANGRTKTYAIQ